MPGTTPGSPRSPLAKWAERLIEASPSGPGLPAGANVIPQTTSLSTDTAQVPVGELWTRLREYVKKVDNSERKHETMIKDIKTKMNEQDEVIKQFKLDAEANIKKDAKTIKEYIDKYKQSDEIMEEKFRILEEQYKYSDKVDDMNEKFEDLNKKLEETVNK